MTLARLTTTRRRTALRWALPLVLCPACVTPAPRIPFRDTAWNASIRGGEWIVNEFVPEADAIGLELVLAEPGSGGWAIEVGARYASGEGDGNRYVFDPANQTSRTLLVDSEREADYYEFTIGVRQTYRKDADVQPYFGVGGALQQLRSEEHFVQPALPGPPAVPEDPQVDHERSEIRPALYMRTGIVWNVLRDQLLEKTEVPLSFDIRGMLGVEYSTLEFTLGFGFGR